MSNPIERVKGAVEHAESVGSILAYISLPDAAELLAHIERQDAELERVRPLLSEAHDELKAWDDYRARTDALHQTPPRVARLLNKLSALASPAADPDPFPSVVPEVIIRAAKRWFYEEFEDDLLEQMEQKGLIAQAEGFSLGILASLEVAINEAMQAQPALAAQSEQCACGLFERASGHTTRCQSTKGSGQ